MWDQLTTFWSLDRAEKHYSLKEQPLNMPLGSQNPYAKRAYWTLFQYVLEDVARNGIEQNNQWFAVWILYTQRELHLVFRPSLPVFHQ